MGMMPQEVVRTAAQSIDKEGFFRPDDARPVRRAVREMIERDALPDHPADLFGPWANLPSVVQGALRRLAEGEITRTMDYHPRGRLWPGLVRGMYAAVRFLQSRTLLPPLSGWLKKWASRAWSLPQNLRERLNRTARRHAFDRGPRLNVEDVLATMGYQPSWLLADYLTGVRVDPRCRGFFADRERNVVFGYLIGIDLIPAPNGIWCVEANLNTAFNDDRRKVLNPEPAVEVLVRSGQEFGASRVVWMDMDWAESPWWLIADLKEEAQAAGLGWEIREGVRILHRSVRPPGVPKPKKRLMAPVHPPRDTLFLRRNTYNVGTDLFVADKGPFTRGVIEALEARGEEKVRVPEMSKDPGKVFSPPSQDLPNLVYKYPSLGKGSGVYFMRVATPDEALPIARSLDRNTGEPPGLFQPFICSRLLPGRRVYDIRAELLITPFGARHAFSIRREASRPLPSHVDPGLVEGAGVFTSNLATGGRFAPLDPREEEEVREAALALGDALIQALNATFETIQ
jgi:hypothetical protein